MKKRTIMKTYEYSLSTNTIWTSFDYGSVKANNREEATLKAIEELKYNLEKCNTALKLGDTTADLSVNMDFSQLEITEIKL